MINLIHDLCACVPTSEGLECWPAFLVHLTSLPTLTSDPWHQQATFLHTTQYFFIFFSSLWRCSLENRELMCCLNIPRISGCLLHSSSLWTTEWTLNTCLVIGWLPICVSELLNIAPDFFAISLQQVRSFFSLIAAPRSWQWEWMEAYASGNCAA